jgi:hypothetical protein
MMSGLPPSAPGESVLISQSSINLFFSWIEPYDNGGSPVTTYDVDILKEGEASSEMIKVVDAHEYTYDSGMFAAGKYYTVKIRAHNFITEYYPSRLGTWGPTHIFYASDIAATV